LANTLISHHQELQSVQVKVSETMFFFPNFNCEMTSTILVQHVLIWIHELRAQSAAIYDQLVQLACVITQSQKV